MGDGIAAITGCTVSPASRMPFAEHAIPHMAGDAIVHARAHKKPYAPPVAIFAFSTLMNNTSDVGKSSAILEIEATSSFS